MLLKIKDRGSRSQMILLRGVAMKKRLNFYLVILILIISLVKLGMVMDPASASQSSSYGQLLTGATSTDPLDNWHWRNPLPQGNGFLSVAYGNNTFVALSFNILTSPDGMTWTPRTARTILDEGLFGVTYAKNMFVAVGGPIFTSPDGVTWTDRSNPADWALNGVVGSNKTIVAVGYHGTIVTSSNGVTWTTRNSGTPADLYGVTYGNNTFVAWGLNGFVLTSPDGVTWTTRTSGYTTLQSITYANNTFVAVGYDGTILTSPDGATWTTRTSGTIYRLLSVTYSNNIFVAVGVYGSVLTSPDGVTWTTRTSGTPLDLYGVTYGNNTFVVVGDLGTILTSPDGVAWTSRTSDLVGDVQINGLAYGNNTFVAAGDDYQTGNFRDFIFTSPDGAAWTKTQLGTNYSLSDVVVGNGIFVIVTAGGATLTSPDGVTWTPNLVNHVQFERVAYGNNTFVAVGNDNTGDSIFTSPDGVTWTPTASFGSYAIAYGNNTFMVAGYDNTGDVIFFSPDGVTWTKTPLGTDDGLSGVAAGNGIFVAVAGDGATFASSDGITWTRRSDFLGFVPFAGVAYGNNTFVAVGGPGFLFTSPDGVTWTLRPFDGGVSEGTLVYGNSTFVVMDNRDILQSDPLSRTQYMLTISENGSGSGTVTSQPPGISCGTTCSASFPQDTTVTLTANPSPTSNFTSWNGCTSVNGSICEVNMTANKAITATFTLKPSSSPIITSLSPTSGTAGTVVTIKGKYFGPVQDSSIVSLNGIPVTTYTSWSDTTIKCAVPAGASTGPVVVTTTVGASNGKNFTVQPPIITSLSPTSGTVGTAVTIKGKYFGPVQGSSTVSFNGIPVTTYTSWSDTTIKCAVPTGGSTGPVVVTTTVGSSNGKTFTVKP